MTARDGRPTAVRPAPARVWSAHAVLPAEPTAPRAARRMVTSVLLAWGCSDHVEQAELVASELVMDAVNGAEPGSVLELRLSADHESIMISVVDGRPGSELPVPNSPAFFLVDRIAQTWGVQSLEQGRRVWARIEVGDPLPG